jgi:hypothetical protein
MRENFKSGSMRGGWQGLTPCLGDLSTAGKPSENARQATESAEPVAYSTAACPHAHTGATTTTTARTTPDLHHLTGLNSCAKRF